jgi:hypothetical protein
MSRLPQPKLKAFGLWQKTSTAGNTYFMRRFGGVRVLVLSNRDRGEEGEPDWNVFFIDGKKPRPADGQGRSASERRASPRRRSA